ncbi:MAG TPA: cell envelope biogenesis protein OmpA [Maribacter sp.]|uniref:OmpA family protein n=1 Tax=unclassified Maribacter TaxID=2615042 RepID=UPI000EC9D098|nr:MULTISPECIES: OmpA family protein [unclassified Maribacter]HAF79048.1 cell envelope biogenesis protein OmpA [Maribacter sp.]|tara:strand:+ start:141129 stop:143042 length:1914 start_codon:yes stop_codon:yes gene_type:complete
MKFKFLITILIIIPLLGFAQDKKSKADNLFYGYRYQQAIAEYKKEMEKKPLTNHQLLNLADSYFSTGNYDNASELYLEVNKNDTIMSVNRFNKMLQSLSKNSERDRVKTFLRSKADKLSPELLENAEFNYSLLEIPAGNEDKTIRDLGVNSPQGDFSPAFYKNGILFSSSRSRNSKNVYGPTGESYLDIYFARISSTNTLVDVETFKEIPATEFHKSTPYYSTKLSTFFYILSNTEDGELRYDENGKNALAIGTLSENGRFRFILKDLSTSFYYPFFDDTTERLYFAANFDDSYGGTDLYYVYTNNGQIMSAPINLGPRINSPGNEIAPYIYEGSLYFSSDVFYGLGGMDVYKSNILANETYTIPVNLGEGINSVSDDFGFIIQKAKEGNGLSGFFASNRKGGKGGDDLYGFMLDKSPGLKTFALGGKVVNLRNKAGLEGAQVRLLNQNGDILKEVVSNSDGSFRIEVPWMSQVTIQAMSDGYSIFSTTYSEEGMEEIQNSSYNMGLAKMEDLVTEREEKTVIKLDKFYFDKGKSTLNAQVEGQLKKVIDAVDRFPQIRLRILSYTDSRGSSSYNKRLSQDRANTIKQYLLNNGLGSHNILEATGYGEGNIVNNCTNGAYCLDFLHKQNERTLFVVE